MLTHDEQIIDQLQRIAEDIEGRGAADGLNSSTAQLERIANALERIAAALEPNRKAWTTEKEDDANLHAILYQLVTGRGGLR
jgi:hypothetical protein